MRFPMRRDGVGNSTMKAWWLVRFGLVTLTATFVGCAATSVQATFVATESCPSDQVTVTTSTFQGWSGPPLLQASI